jgi:hypothetical protein
MEVEQNKENCDVTHLEVPVWLDITCTRFAWGKVRPWQEEPCFAEAAASGNYD